MYIYMSYMDDWEKLEEEELTTKVHYTVILK